MQETLIVCGLCLLFLFVGSWLSYRARNGQSPLPRVWPESKPDESEKTKGFVPPKVKP